MPGSKRPFGGFSVHISGPRHSVFPGSTFHDQQWALGYESDTLRARIIWPDGCTVQGLHPGPAPA